MPIGLVVYNESKEKVDANAMEDVTGEADNNNNARSLAFTSLANGLYCVVVDVARTHFKYISRSIPVPLYFCLYY